MAEIIIKSFVEGIYRANCYVVRERDSKKAVLIDCPAWDDKIDSYIKSNGLELEMILLTHGHFDHIGGLKSFKEHYPEHKLVISQKEAPFLSDDRLNLNWFISGDWESITHDIEVKDGDVITAAGLELKVIATPGHTAGSVCFLADDCLFSGDTLFKRDIGRCDHATGDIRVICKSILNKLFSLDNDIRVYPGHGMSTTIGREKESNEVYYWAKKYGVE